MKKMKFSFLCMASITCVMMSCNMGGKDSKSAADSANNAKASMADSMNKASTSSTDSANKKMVSGFKDDAHFVVDAAEGGMFEVKTGKLALKNSTNPEVKRFAEMMIQDHTKWGNSVKAYASSKSITVPDSLGNSHKDKVTDLSKEAGSAFDKDYMDAMVSDHKDDLDAFRDAAKNAKDPKLQQIAATTATGIEHHLAEAKRVDSLVKK